MTGILLRRVDITDALMRAAISSLHADCYGAADNPYTPVAGTWWIAFAGKNAVAFAGIQPSQQRAAAGYLCRAGVLPAYRGQGLQVRLIRQRLQWAREQGWRTVVTDTHRNPASANSLIKCGFRLFEPEKPWSFSTALYWRKDVCPPNR